MTEAVGETEAVEAADRAMERLAEAEQAAERAERAVDEVGESRVVAAADAYREASGLLDRYEDRATGTGNFEAYVEFQNRFLGLVEDLPDDLPTREAFEDAAGRLDRRRLDEADFAAARESLEAAAEYVGMLDERDEATERRRRAEHDLREACERVVDRIAELERLERLGEADLSAPVERLSEPIETYNDAVRADFEQYRERSSARSLLDLLDRAASTPLVDERAPPAELAAYVRDNEAGAEPLPTLLEYADYSASKLDHYVEDPGALRAAVATHRTYLSRVDAAALTVDWPPPPAGQLRFRCRELATVVGRFADDQTVERLRRVRRLPRTTDYERLRTAAQSRAELGADARARLERGAVGAELDRLRSVRTRIGEALDG